eukprot:TRINITY_DN2462_c0_g1_i3.p2 TRINITY_DN2462_c0_g1~~TRINITY_DN2462_c0_g1_i3.p2  ORF type:complete len:119 (+),score=20.21 TRINITY_DN2462_c0_g1_i3:313-669(+)
MPTTIADFWRMIWEQEACVIVMLTELVSTDGQAKAHVYWPISRELSLVVGHNFKVTLLNEIQEGSITVRFLEMGVLTTNKTHFFKLPRKKKKEKKKKKKKKGGAKRVTKGRQSQKTTL